MSTVAECLQSVVAAGLTSTLAIAIATGMSDADVTGVLSGESAPTGQQREQLESLVREYERATTGGLRNYNGAGFRFLRNPAFIKRHG
jgi:hypothetical protein